jgi:Zn-dependent peptidase ImmA (M78 family)
MNYKEIQNEVISKYRVDICDGSKCEDDWQRTHAHVKKRRVCKWKQANSAESTFTLFHEIGHIETHTSKMRRCESEYYATVWAIEKMREYGVVDKISDKVKKLYQDYIIRERDRGVRRGGANYPTEQQLTLEW